jgi:hypothetical protein
MPQWRQDYPNNRPPTWATLISAVGQKPPPGFATAMEELASTPDAKAHNLHKSF